MKARNKKSGEIVEYHLDDSSNYVVYEIQTHYICNENEFNELYEVITDTKKDEVTSSNYWYAKELDHIPYIKPGKVEIISDEHPYEGREVLDNAPVEEWEHGNLIFDNIKDILNICNVKHVQIQQNQINISFAPKNATGNHWKELKERMHQITEK